MSSVEVICPPLKLDVRRGGVMFVVEVRMSVIEVL